MSKRAAGQRAAEWVQDGMYLGLGTGSTATCFIEALAQRVQDGLKVSCVATSKQSYDLAERLGLNVGSMKGVTTLDMTVDGADEIDDDHDMIKGGGGALLREKLIAAISHEMVVIVDASKKVKKLGQFPLPIEVVPFGIDATLASLSAMGLQPSLRMSEGNLPFITDGEHLIVDVNMRCWKKGKSTLEHALKALPAVVEVGLFLGMAGRVIVGHDDGSTKILER